MIWLEMVVKKVTHDRLLRVSYQWAGPDNKRPIFVIYYPDVCVSQKYFFFNSFFIYKKTFFTADQKTDKVLFLLK